MTNKSGQNGGHGVIAFSPELRARVNQKHLRRGRLFGAILQDELTPEDREALQKAGWTPKAYRDKAVLVPPSMTVAWDHEHAIFRDHMLHATAHRLPTGLPAHGNGLAILEELIASTWEEREEQLRVVLNAFAFASLLPGPGGHAPAGETGAPETPASAELPPERMESYETFFFYAASMRQAAAQALRETVKAPDPDDAVWTLVDALMPAP